MCKWRVETCNVREHIYVPSSPDRNSDVGLRPFSGVPRVSFKVCLSLRGAFRHNCETVRILFVRLPMPVERCCPLWVHDVPPFVVPI